jgi:hypothetical protein
MSAPNNGKKIIATGGWSKSPNARTPAAVPVPTPVSTPGPQHPPSLLNKVKSAVEAYASRGITQDKRCTEDIKKTRLVSCHGDPERGIAPCPFRRDSSVEEGRYYCGECGCGDRKATWLNAKQPDDYTKLDFPKVVCPLNMPGFSNYTPSADESVERRMRYDFSRKEQIERQVDLTIKQTDEKS